MVGLDPTFMYLYDQELYWQWRKVADDNPDDWQSVEQLHYVVSDQLKAKYIFIETDRNGDLYDYINSEDPKQEFFQLGFDEGQIAIFSVK